ncbi:MAG: metallophosphoesterase, partial [Candidatus Woesearchaeota archaeon]
MRLILVSDSHTKENIEFIYEYIKKKAIEWKPDLIIINGDILGENEIRENYGFNYNRTIFLASLNKEKILSSIFSKYQELKKHKELYELGKNNDSSELEFSNLIREYLVERYNYLFEILTKFSEIKKTLFNCGNYESPLQYNILKELAFLLEMDETYIRRIALLSNYRDIFKEFLSKFKDNKKLKYIGALTSLEQDIIVAGIPGFNPSSLAIDKLSEFQEKTTEDLISTIKRQLSFANKLLILNQTQGKLTKDPFTFRPQSKAVREFIEELKTEKYKLKQKIFLQSYHHFMTTHFYFASDFHFILNNSAVNNCLFNIIDIGNKVECYDVDPKKDKIRKLKLYNYNLVDYNKPEERLNLNYEDSDEIIKERNLESCYY